MFGRQALAVPRSVFVDAVNDHDELRNEILLGAQKTLDS